MLIPVALVLHVLAVVVWVGGMFFAHMALRPSVATLPPEVRLPLLGKIFARFLPWVWASVLIILTTGYGAIFILFGSVVAVSHPIGVMMLLGNLMVGLFLYLWFFPYRRLQSALAEHDIKAAGLQQVLIRRVILTNLVLGLVTISVATAGRW